MSRMSVHRTAVVLGLFGVWEAIVRLRWVDSMFISAPIDIARALVAILGDPHVLAAARVTGYELMSAYVISCVVGVTVGLLISQSDLLHRTTNPIIMLLFSVPKIALLPLMVLFFGIGIPSKIVYGTISGCFPVLLNVTAGMRLVDPVHRRTAHVLGASRWQEFTKVILPASLPAVMTGLRLGINQATLGVLLAELFGASKGLGSFVSLWSSSFKPAPLFALFFLIAALAMILNRVLQAAERSAGKWQEDGQEGVRL